ncbi:hypothetical protein [Caulobacter sp. DWR2-3-1b2]|uniref:hypothetical protein n=1 Tax=Caulobacter sp. DWR2-3-1b2 TaxID=2804642 RepID=UPI003CEFEBAF
MAAKIASSSATFSKQSDTVLGRSAATGRFVLKPASKSGTISLKQAKAAVANVRNNKKT